MEVTVYLEELCHCAGSYLGVTRIRMLHSDVWELAGIPESQKQFRVRIPIIKTAPMMNQFGSTLIWVSGLGLVLH